MSLIEQIVKDKEFGQEIMVAAGIRTLGSMPLEGIQINIMAWFARGNQIGPVIAYYGNETSIALMWPYHIKEPRLFQQTLKKALPIIKKTSHTGQVTLRCLINVYDRKAYGIRWHTAITKEIMKATGGILKCAFGEWTNWLSQGLEGNVADAFHYKYSGSIVDQLVDINGQLLMFKALGYEIPSPINGGGATRADDQIPDPARQ